jgi:hypothetical protein
MGCVARIQLRPRLTGDIAQVNGNGCDMTTRIEKDGWVVSGSTLDELRLGIRAVQEALASGKAKSPSIDDSSARAPVTSASTSEHGKLMQSKDQVLRFLTALPDFPTGVSTEDLAKAINLKSQQATGALVIKVNRFLKHVGIEPEAAYRTTKAYDGPKYWHPSPELELAIRAIEHFDA